MEEIVEFESDSKGDANSDDENATTHVESISNVATFLVGHSSRYSRVVTFNKKYVS